MTDLRGPVPLNRQPIGLLDFFGIKNGGRYPVELIDRLQPSIDLLRHYTETAAQIFTWSGTLAVNQSASSTPITATNPTDLASGGNVDVPPNELWYIAAAHIQWTMTDVGGRAEFNIADTDAVGAVPGYSRYWPARLQGATAGAAGITTRGIKVIAEPVYVLPGRRLVVPHNGVLVGAGQVDWFGSISIVRMKI